MATRSKPCLTPVLGIVALCLFALNLHRYVRHLAAPPPVATDRIEVKRLDLRPHVLPALPGTGMKRYEWRFRGHDGTAPSAFEHCRLDERARTHGEGVSTIALVVPGG